MVLVTGGAQGLGKSLVIELAKCGYDILIGYLNSESNALELCKHIIDTYKVKCFVNKMDIICEKDVKRVFKEYSIDVVINNASLSNDNYIEDKSFDEFMAVVKVNLGGTYLMCKYDMPPERRASLMPWLRGLLSLII